MSAGNDSRGCPREMNSVTCAGNQCGRTPNLLTKPEQNGNDHNSTLILPRFRGEILDNILQLNKILDQLPATYKATLCLRR